MTDYLTEADEIHADYTRGKTTFQAAVIAFLWLIARLMIERRDRETPSVVPMKKAK